MLGLRTFFDSQADPNWTSSYEVRLERDSYRIVVAEGRLSSLTRGDTGAQTDVRIDTDLAGWQALLSRSQSLPAAIEAGRVTIIGDRPSVQNLLDAVQT